MNGPAPAENYGYRQDDIVMLTDDARNPAQLPTKANINRGMQWLVKDARPNDSLFFHCEIRILNPHYAQLILKYEIPDMADKLRILMETSRMGM